MLNDSGKQLTIMTKAIIRRNYAFVTKLCLKCALSPKWDTLTICERVGLGISLSRKDLHTVFFSVNK